VSNSTPTATSPPRPVAIGRHAAEQGHSRAAAGDRRAQHRHEVGIGFKPHKYLKVGDRVRVEIDKLGAIENEVIAEPDSTTLI
jgi:2-keto-4-pentenoate hydratase/2-oxohepta-3-ene-1,7-dioic acid hydratase in catechol pathway